MDSPGTSLEDAYGLTQQPYLVFTANVFALMGLRQLYFLLGDLLKRLVYLSQGLAFILAFIGVKLVLHALHENELPFINGGSTWRAGDSDPAQPGGDCGDARYHHRGQPVQDPGERREDPVRFRRRHHRRRQHVVGKAVTRVDREIPRAARTAASRRWASAAAIGCAAAQRGRWLRRRRGGRSGVRKPSRPAR